jgi:hypothetical protein
MARGHTRGEEMMLSRINKLAKRAMMAVLFTGLLTVALPNVKANTLRCYNSMDPGVIVCYSTGSSAGPYMFYYDTIRRIYW